MKISKEKLTLIIKEELDDYNLKMDQDNTVDDLVYELSSLMGRDPTPEEVGRIRNAVLSEDASVRGDQ